MSLKVNAWVVNAVIFTVLKNANFLGNSKIWQPQSQSP